MKGKDPLTMCGGYSDTMHHGREVYPFSRVEDSDYCSRDAANTTYDALCIVLVTDTIRGIYRQ